MFPTHDKLRKVLARCLGALNVEAHGLVFVWHGFRHGGASRAFLREDEMSTILVRGRWAAESSGRHYIQSGRQLLLAQNMPAAVTDWGLDPGAVDFLQQQNPQLMKVNKMQRLDVDKDGGISEAECGAFLSFARVDMS